MPIYRFDERSFKMFGTSANFMPQNNFKIFPVDLNDNSIQLSYKAKGHERQNRSAVEHSVQKFNIPYDTSLNVNELIYSTVLKIEYIAKLHM